MFCFKYCCAMPKYWSENEFRMCQICSPSHYNCVTCKLSKLISHIYAGSDCETCALCLIVWPNSLLIVRYIVTTLLLSHPCYWIYLYNRRTNSIPKTSKWAIRKYITVLVQLLHAVKNIKFIKINSNAILKQMMPRRFWNARIITLLWLFLRWCSAIYVC